jgi:hypothetical protein
MRLLVTVGMFALASAGALAQDPIATLPDAYRLLLENEWVKVTRVTYAPHAVLPAHTHTEHAAAYVYLNDSGPVAFKHVGAEYGAVTRPPTKARSFRLYRGIKEVHEVENLSPLPSDFLRVEFKTDPGDPRSLRGKFFAVPFTGRVESREQFANSQLRVTRIALPPGTNLDLDGDTVPSLLVFVSTKDAGTVRWLPRGNRERLSNTTTEPIEALRFELRTTPMTAR